MPLKKLSDLLTQNRLPAFFTEWSETVHPTSSLNRSFRTLQADWNRYAEAYIQGNTNSARSKEVVDRAFALVDQITPADLEVAAPPTQDSPSISEKADMDDPLRQIIREKLSFLQEARVKAVDPNVQFSLDKEIGDLKEQLKGLG
ncbi:hypothetical protein [Neolewinella persica]|uniref:hypothetical protein n=1 Tax=Neolewinella persica TaxID=70998 RepID=UPI00036D7880|nr:hypothetical protein [Neolewinella persica]